MKERASVNDAVMAVAAIVQQQGQHDFPSYCAAGGDVRSASLCGLSVYIKDSRVIRLKARDMEIALDSQPYETANDEQIVNFSDFLQYNFIYGSEAELERWFVRLSRFQSVFGFAPRREQEIRSH